MPVFFSYIPLADVNSGLNPVTLLKSATSILELRADRSYDPEQAGSIDASQVADTGGRDDVKNRKTGSIITAAICAVS
jgi:hypothetical protein